MDEGGDGRLPRRLVNSEHAKASRFVRSVANSASFALAIYVWYARLSTTILNLR